MAFKVILINAEDEPSLPGLLAVAQPIAARYHSQVVGLSILPSSLTLPSGVPGTHDAIKFDSHRNSACAEAERAQQVFTRWVSEKQLSGAWRLDDDDGRDRIDALVARCRLVDLVVCSTAERGQRPFHTAERLVVEAGRPVILVPRASQPAECSRRVLIAWNGSREAVRAVFDALPLLQAARHVKVLQVSTSDRARIAGLDTADVCSMLYRHGVRAASESLSLPRGTAGAALLSAARAENADLLVMGGYGHWRFRELVLGGATHHVLRHTSIPVLMSH